MRATITIVVVTILFFVGLGVLVALGILRQPFGRHTVPAALNAAGSQLEDMDRQTAAAFADAACLPDARNRLAKAREKRIEVAKTLAGFRRQSATAHERIKRYESEKAVPLDQFRKLQAVLQNEGVPKYADATQEDKARTIQIGAQTYTVESVFLDMRILKAGIERKNNAITVERIKVDNFEKLANVAHIQMSRVDGDIAVLELKIAEATWKETIIAAHGSFKDTPMSGIIPGLDDAIEVLNKKLDELNGALKAFELTPTESVGESTTITITDDDWI